MASVSPGPTSGQPIEDESEGLLRRVPPVFYPAGKPRERPDFNAFLPRRWQSEDDPGDSTGLSVTREKFAAADQVALHPTKGVRQTVVRLTVEQVRRVGLSAIEDPIAGNPGHALIPQLNSIDYKKREMKNRIKEWAQRLALQECEIVYDEDF